ncbi:SDR family oxidoreductase [Gloeocapsopsis dulcis]|uniref:3-ketoacyl-ACP reductase n=1 Tax=Gloeocapsopsis dulcis AAB1 = 1H9 TaxID=1433147 RepID=A0A6N8FV69_9CHRO|nr:SDR family oxidoreductase [Gloeocapsopsis dulcis]MUL36841.1 3-ketoacyl-ACP reductase [Gloeocapsopsis dulcis AAB1 = 1H9]WNN88552.1 SDR family oxidoreductase [Gloeocapsopsis dulcis]
MPEAVLKGRVALVTGVGRRKGIGFAIAQQLAILGADVFIHSFSPYDASQAWGADPDGVPALIATLQEHGTRIAHAEGNFLDPVVPHQIMNTAVQIFGHIDILVVNHAYSTTGNLEELTAAEIDIHLQVNVQGTLLLVQAFAAQHQGRSGGRVILLTSGQHLNPMPSELAYIASKGALHQLTLSLSAHLIPRGITVNAINPGATDTGYATAELYESVRAANPQGRWGQPEDAARLIGWLVTDDAQWVTGQVINSTGGGV